MKKSKREKERNKIDSGAEIVALIRPMYETNLS